MKESDIAILLKFSRGIDYYDLPQYEKDNFIKTYRPDQDWNELMKLREKINATYLGTVPYKMMIYPNMIAIEQDLLQPDANIHVPCDGADKAATLKAILLFIQKYNEINTKPDQL